MYKYKRICKECGKELFYKSSSAYHLAIKNDSICKSCASIKRRKINNNLNILLNEDLESYYWIGFILADGHFNKNGRLQITLSNIDEEHLKKFCKYISCDNFLKRTNIVSVNAIMKEASLKIMEKFDIKNNKTYNPPSLEYYNKLENDKLISLICGFIDGDGNIKHQHNRKDCVLQIHLHSSWIHFLKMISITLTNKDFSKISKDGYSRLSITNNSILKKLKCQALNFNLPLLERKWEKIDLNYKTFYEVAKEKYNEFEQLYSQNIYSLNDICEIMKIKYNRVYSYKIKYNKKYGL